MSLFSKSIFYIASLFLITHSAFCQEARLHSGKLPDDGIIHWYALEMIENDEYWKDVNTSHIVVECNKGITEDQPDFKKFINLNNLSLYRKSAYPEIQNFFIFNLSSAGKERILEIVRIARKFYFILYAEPEPINHLTVCNPNDTYYGTQWGPKAIRADSLWCTYKGAGKSFIAVIDNAVDWNHEDLVNTVKYAYDFANNDNDPSPDNSSEEHGTHVSGIVSAKIGNAKGIAGISNDTIFFAKISDGSGLQYAAILDALNYISTDSRIRVINMSFGSLSINAGEQSGVNLNWSKGKLLIASAGNNASASPFYPASYSNVVSVSAVGKNNSSVLSFASYSNYGSLIDITGPGGEANTNFPINSTLPGNKYGGVNWVGTSMSAPHVSAVAGLIFDANPLLTNAQARGILESETIEMGAVGWDQYYGNGMVCASCAFRKACNQLAFSIGVSGSIQLCPGKSIVISAPKGNVDFNWYKDNVLLPGENAYYISANQAGIYTASVSSAAGLCKATSKNAVTIINALDPVPDFTYTANNKTITFTNKSSSAISYSWDFGDGVKSPEKNPIYSYTADGVYQVTLTATNLCGVSKTVTYTVNVLSAGIAELSQNASLHLYPDPADQFIDAHLSKNNDRISGIFISDLQGRIVKNEIVNGDMQNPERLDISKLRDGVYFIHIISSSQSLCSKFVIAR